MQPTKGLNKAWTFQHVRQTTKHEAECFAQRNCDVIQNGAEMLNHGTKKTRVSFRLLAQGTYTITGNPED